jgi:signal transduction histidine kinase
MIRLIGKSGLWLSLLMSSILPMLLGLALSHLFSDWRWIHYPSHSMVESVGTVCALTIATLMFIMIRNDHLSRRFVVVACALIGMGVLDGFHSVLYVNTAFVWLHSVATMVGGVMFASIWFAEAWITEKRQQYLLYATITLSILLGAVSVMLPDNLPDMIMYGEFSLAAKIINITGGTGFLIGAYYFVHAFYFKKDTRQSTAESNNENMVFANHCLLFGIAGILFEASVLWDAGWWWWHILRLLAYLVVLIYFFVLFKQAHNQLKQDEIELAGINRELELRVQQRTSELEKASQAKSEFLSRMSHELRTPMNAILGFGQLLEMNAQGFTAAQRDNIQEIIGAGNHLLYLINEVLDLARIESGKMDTTIVAVSVDTVLQQCLALTGQQLKAQQLTLIDHVSGKGYTVLADFTRTKQVLLNLLSNAVKYNSERGSITLDSEIIDNKKLRIRVADTGNGLSEAEIARLFIPFDRLNAASHIDGAGIGLVITRNLLELMNGTLGVDSVPGEGAGFWFELPLSEAG